MQETLKTGRGLRSDAARNIERITAAAMAAFAECGIEVAISDVAERAGVGVGTVYRHFGDKDGLIKALFDAKVVEVTEMIETALDRDTPEDAFMNVCMAAAELFAENRGLRQLLLDGSAPTTEYSLAAIDRLIPAVDAIVANAQAVGWLRESFSSSDFPMMMLALGAVRDVGGRGAHPEIWRRILLLMIDGVRPDSREPSDLPVPPPLTSDQTTALLATQE
ncbi:TetR/AcrR family transcriptional regulator [Gordonia sp. ABSL1-1]|uniref:TetR/AcrR family transcriptional regulator n=1 Tax=Gordonia sp. ABSL1-1 TaxID=3053923 RepID=UPI0025741726|nr:TetR/AcrR family transcriptional regulator [Gordonia sp. ABSL1-1]MDL9936629.1 TetR/AcrR family transcriptional regulator [Gordonia sp. ABSL1-1]